MTHNVAQADHADKSSGLWVVRSSNYDQTVHAADLDQREDGAERILWAASDDSREIDRTLF